MDTNCGQGERIKWEYVIIFIYERGELQMRLVGYLCHITNTKFRQNVTQTLSFLNHVPNTSILL